MKTTRTAGLLYLLPMFLGPFSMMFVPSRVLVVGDAAATLEHLRASETLFRLGVASDLVIVLAEVALTAVLFVLFEQVSRVLALVATFARLVMTALQGANVLLSLGALGAATRGDATQTLSLLEVHGQGVHAWEVVFALHCFALAVLVFRSGTVPRAFGPLLALAGAGYLVNGFGALLVPSTAPVFASIVGLTAVVGEVPFVFWLVLSRRS
jgi:hypothetical protein